MNNFIRLLCHIAANKKGRVKDAEKVLDLLSRANKATNQSPSIGNILENSDENGRTPLSYAAQGNLAIVKWLVEEKNVWGNVATGLKDEKLISLYVAALAGQLETVEYLLEKDAKPMESDDAAKYDYDSVYLAAVRSNNVKVLEKLLDKKFTVDVHFLFEALIEAIDNNNTQCVAALLAHHPTLANIYQLHNISYNPLKHALRGSAHPYIIALLYAMNPELVINRDNIAKSAMIKAIKDKNLPAIFLFTNSYSITLAGKTYSVTEREAISKFNSAWLLRNTLTIALERSNPSSIDEQVFYLLIKAGCHVDNTLVDLLLDESYYYVRFQALKAYFVYTVMSESFKSQTWSRGRHSMISELDLTYLDIKELVSKHNLTHRQLLEQVKYFEIVTGQDNLCVSEWREHFNNQTQACAAYDLSEYPGLKTENDELAYDYLSGYENKTIEPEIELIQPPATTGFNGFNDYLMKVLTDSNQTAFINAFNALEEFLQDDELFLGFSKLASFYHADLENEFYLDINRVHNDGNNLLTRAIRDSKNEVVFILLKKNANANFRLPSSETPLLIAAEVGNEVAFDYLIKFNADITAVNAKNQNFVILATINGQTESFRFVKEAKQLLSQADNEGRDALTYAILADNLECVEHLHARGAKIIIDQNFWDIITQRDSINIFKYICDNSHWDLELYYQTLVYYAVKNDAKKIFEAIESKINFEARDEDGNTLLHLAVNSSTEIFLSIIKHKVSFNIVNNYQESVLDKLVYAMYHAKMSASVKENISVFFKNKDNLNANELIDYAIGKIKSDASSADPQILSYLLKFCLLFLLEKSHGELICSSKSKRRLAFLRTLIGAIVFLVCSGDKKSCRVALERIENGTLGKVLDHHEYLDGLFKSTTYNRIQELISNPLASENQLLQGMADSLAKTLG